MEIREKQEKKKYEKKAWFQILTQEKKRKLLIKQTNFQLIFEDMGISERHVDIDKGTPI